MRAVFFLVGLQVQNDEVCKRILLGDNRGCGRGHAAADRVSVCWSLDCNCTAFDVPIYI